MVLCLLLLAIMLYLHVTSDKTLMSFTGPNDDWLIGLENIPELVLPDHDFNGSLKAIGIGFFRIDFLTNKKEE